MRVSQAKMVTCAPGQQGRTGRGKDKVTRDASDARYNDISSRDNREENVRAKTQKPTQPEILFQSSPRRQLEQRRLEGMRKAPAKSSWHWNDRVSLDSKRRRYSRCYNDDRGSTKIDQLLHCPPTTTMPKASAE